MNIERILFATDFSATSKKAMGLARNLKDKLGAELVVLHVFDQEAFDMPLPYGMMPGAATWSADHVHKVKEHARESLDDVRLELGEIDGHFVEGNPGHAIVEYAEKCNADMIIMGTHGYKGFRRVLMGSVAEYVLRHTKRVVITVKGDEE
ncbi:MAG: universal stress protein [Acidobacteriota bacterium]|nr:universal stress protein [Acidobacteriota bacterium]